MAENAFGRALCEGEHRACRSRYGSPIGRTSAEGLDLGCSDQPIGWDGHKRVRTTWLIDSLRWCANVPAG